MGKNNLDIHKSSAMRCYFQFGDSVSAVGTRNTINIVLKQFNGEYPLNGRVSYRFRT